MNNLHPDLISVLIVSFGLGLTTFAVVTATSFIKISVVMFLLRNALGIQQTPPNVVLYSVALVLTVFISAPVAQEVQRLFQQNNAQLVSFQDWMKAAERSSEPVRQFLAKFTNPTEREFFLAATKKIWPNDMQEGLASTDLAILLPSFMLSELKRAFEIGFLIYLPFIAVDLVISVILMALGMSMVPPITISVPFKLFLFVTIDGWSRLFHGLVLSYM